MTFRSKRTSGDCSGSLSRRDLLRYAAMGGGVLCAGRLPGMGLGAVANPMAQAAATSDTDRTLVVLQLSGGNDGLNTLVPVGNDDYRRARPRLGLKGAGLHRLTDELALHPSLGRIAQRWHDGGAAIIQGVGYPQPNRSHFKSMDIWHSGRPDGGRRDTGWLGRAMERLPEAQRGTECAVNMSTKEPLALLGDGFHPVSFTDPRRFRLRTDRGQEQAVEALTGAQADSDEILDLVGRTAADARGSSARIRKAVAAYKPALDYPDSRLGRSLRNASAMLDAGLGSRVVYAYLGSFDTHANQAGRHGALLRQLDEALSAFLGDLEAAGRADKVTVLVFSEFGRRVAENASGGTDHGTAGPVMVFGPTVAGGLHGAMPSLTELDKGDLVYTTDFRSIYRDLLEGWLKVGPGEYAQTPGLGLIG